MSEILVVEFLDSISNAHDCMVVERLVHARRFVAAFVDALAY